MTIVFISYTRKDTAFARKVTDRFKDQNVDYWIDWEGIPPTVDWWKEIEKGIEQADAFLFLLSLDSVKSEVCKREIEHAAKNGKRLVPIVVRDVQGSEAHPELSLLNWIFLRESDDFDSGFQKLLTAINTDYEWVQTHKDLQNKGLEWERNNHESGLLLHGKELQDAESQLALNSSKEPYPTALQREYVLKSRQGNDRTRRRLITGLISFSVILLVLFVFAIIQLNTSRALQLAASAQAAFAEQNYSLSALYAYQSNQIHGNQPANSLLSKFPYINFPLGKGLLGHTYPVLSVAWSADGRLASGSSDNTVIIWDVATGKRAQTLRGHSDVVTSVAWSADGRLASGSYDNTVIIWDFPTGKPTKTLKGHTESVTSVAWSADGRLASGSRDGTVILWDLATGKPGQTLKGHSGAVSNVAWSADGRLASGSDNIIMENDTPYLGSGNTVIIWDLTTGKPTEPLKEQPNFVTSVAWSADGRLASGSYDSTLIWDLNTGKPAQTLQGHTDIVTSVAWSADGRLASGSYDSNLILWDLATGKPAQTLKGHSGEVTSVAWSADGHLASGSLDRSIVIWDLTAGQPAQTLQGYTDTVTSVAWSADGRLASGSADNNVTIWDLDTGKPAQTLQGHTDTVTSVAWSADGRLASGSADGKIIIWDSTTGKPAQTLQGYSDRVDSVAWSADGRLASASNSGVYDGKVILWDLASGKPAQTFQMYNTINSVAWSADGRLASATWYVTIWNLATGQPAQVLDDKGRFNKEEINSIAWSPDGRLASGSRDNKVIIWDLATGEPAETLQGETHPFNDILDRSFPVNVVAWSADGRLASMSDNNTVIIWDLASGQPVRTLQGHTDTVRSLTWSADGRLASGSSDGTVKIARADLTGSKSCNWIISNMSAEEWISAQGVLYIYERACPSLPSPVIDPVAEWRLNGWNSALQYELITWMGRLVLLVIAVIPLLIVAVVIRGLYQLAMQFRSRFFNR